MLGGSAAGERTARDTQHASAALAGHVGRIRALFLVDRRRRPLDLPTSAAAAAAVAKNCTDRAPHTLLAFTPPE